MHPLPRCCQNPGQHTAWERAFETDLMEVGRAGALGGTFEDLSL